MDKAKFKIEEAVNKYIDENPEEARAFLEAHKIKQETQKDEFGSIDSEGTLKRVMYEMPETLFVKLKMGLEDDEFEWYSTSEGSRWFVKKFKAFSLTKE